MVSGCNCHERVLVCSMVSVGAKLGISVAASIATGIGSFRGMGTTTCWSVVPNITNKLRLADQTPLRPGPFYPRNPQTSQSVLPQIAQRRPNHGDATTVHGRLTEARNSLRALFPALPSISPASCSLSRPTWRLIQKVTSVSRPEYRAPERIPAKRLQGDSQTRACLRCCPSALAPSASKIPVAVQPAFSRLLAVCRR